MITNALLLAQGQPVVGVFNPWALLGLVAFVAFVIFCIHRAVKFLDSWRREQKLIRMEVGKLADELEKARKQAKNNEEDNPSDKSG